MNIDELIEENKYIVVRVLNRYLKTEMFQQQREDYMQIGLIALWKAIMDYEEEKNDNFEAYAYTCIRNDIRNEIRKALKLKRGANEVVLSLNASAPEFDDISLEEVIPDQNGTVVLNTDAFLENLDKDDIQIMRLKGENRTINEISSITGFSRKHVMRRTEAMKKKLKENVI